MKHIPFGSTPRLPSFYFNIKSKLTYDFQIKNKRKFDEETDTLEFPKLTLIGTEKIHGTNGAVCFNAQDGFWVQSNSRIITPESDNEGCASAAMANKDVWITLLKNLAATHKVDLSTHTITIFYEWCGGSIMKGNSALFGHDKVAIVFSYAKVTPTYATSNDEYERIETSKAETAHPPSRIFNIKDFPTYKANIDLSNYAKVETQLQGMVDTIENNSPVGEQFGTIGNTAEGIYWWTEHNGKLVNLKSKGEKHGGKPKERKPKLRIDDDEVRKRAAIAELVTPVWRITQGVNEVNATSMKDIGKLLKWVHRDILKEDTVLLDGYALKDIQRYTTQVIKDYFETYLKT